ncbi:uncharacterized protein N0V89_010710 [Didymosphaeria variabile]|uniref:Transcription factor domain-containing protein n=1 Tax=Didymosphaeria variabile TaxID=1932322 RepID=A0A9W9C6U4_9PLEO|nr:uncharacterized protein N0V89_010710 [Didymosphaeria variabile]KAJ4346778.1 hypothetical protein N0V89_010710 [Didymosphaeria variabile]
MAASQIHLKGAATLIRQRGTSQFSSLVGHGMFVRLRGSILALCLMTSEPLPDYFIQHLKEEKLKDNDFEMVFYTLLNRVCGLRARQKRAGFVSDAMAEDAKATIQQFDDWHPDFPAWVMPPGHRSYKKDGTAPGVNTSSMPSADKDHRFIWVAMSWLIMHTSRLLVFDILVIYYRAQQAILPSPETKEALQRATTAQIDLAQDIQDTVEYYLDTLISSQASTRSIGAHMLMMPLSVLLGLSTTGPETLVWVARMASRIAEVFALKQGKIIADFLMKGWKGETFALSPVNKSLSRTDTLDLAGEGMGTPEDGPLTPSPTPDRKIHAEPDILIS